MAICKWCKAEVLWALHQETGKPAPLDPQPSEDGNIVIVGQPASRVYAIVPRNERAQYAGRLHKNHWSTCPEADKHLYTRTTGPKGVTT